MADLPAPRERRTAKVVIYVTPGDANNLAAFAQSMGMSLSELGGQLLHEAYVKAQCLQRQTRKEA